jgi:hypothetical protein
MTEISPRITYSPDGILELRRKFDEIDMSQTLFRTQEILDCMPGYEVSESEPDTVLKIDIARVLNIGDERDLESPSAINLLKNIRSFTCFDHFDDRDGVISFDYWHMTGAGGIIYPQFQRWLNAKGLNEEAAFRCIQAMAYPLGRAALKEAANDFSFVSSGRNSGVLPNGIALSVVSKVDRFNITMLDERRSRHGDVDWNWVDLNTFGSCACWGGQRSGKIRSAHLARFKKTI